MKKIILLSFSLWVSACGGGGNEQPPINNNQPSSSSVVHSSSLSNFSSSSISFSSSITSSSSSQQTSSSGFVFIPDIDLKNAIRDQLNLASNAEITASQMQSINSLSLADSPSSLTGLETATQLSSLIIENEDSNNQSLDLSPLSSLESLNSLTLHGIDQLNLTPIQNLRDIQELIISNSSITSLSPLAGFTQLRTLYLNSNDLTDLPDFFNQFTLLTELNVSYNPLESSDLAPLQSLKIRNLVIDNTDIDQLEFLAQNNRLDYLSIRGTPVFDLSPLLTSGLSQGEFISANYSCLFSGKYASHPDIATQLRQKGILLLDHFQEPGSYGDYDDLKACGNHLDDIVASATANYQNNQLLISWTLDTSSESNLTCEIYFDLQNQQPRNPSKVINNCHQLTQDSLATILTQAPVSLVVWDTYGSKKIIQSQLLGSAPSGLYLHSYDFGQTLVKPDAKLIPGKAALLRLHVLSNQSSPVPDITLSAERNSVITNISVTKPASLSSSKNFRSASAAYRANIPAELMQPGLSIRININSQEKIITPIFGEANTLYLTLIPIRIQNSTGILPSHNTIRNSFLELWPFADVQLNNRAAYTADVSSADDMDHLLYDIAELQTLDGDDSHYYGVFSSSVYDDLNFNGFGGIAFIGDTSGIGKDNDTNLEIMLHELGHNFNLRHINCGGPDSFDPLYPYSPNSLGSLGIGRDLQTLYSPTAYTDIMSYCNNQFVSDYSYEKAQDYLEENPSQEFNITNTNNRVALAAPTKTLFVSGLVGTESAELRRLIPSTHATTIHSTGKYKLNIVDQQNNSQQYYFETKQLDHIENAPRFFSLIIPYTNISQLEIFKGDQLLYRQTEQLSVNPNNNIAAQKSLSIPEVIQNTNGLCLHWDNQAYEFASLQLKLADSSLSTLFMDTTDSPYCLDFTTVDNAESWNIILRKGLRVQEFSQSAN